jgi:hypothetical protein
VIIRKATILCFQDLSQLKRVDLRIAAGRIMEIVSRITNRDYDGPLQRY